MTVIYITENNFECYAVTFQNNGCVKVQQFEDVSESDKKLYTQSIQWKHFWVKANVVV